MVSLVKINQATNTSPYILFFAGLRSPHTQTAYKQDLIQFIRFLNQYYRGVKPETAEEHHLISFINNLKRNKASDRTINRKIAFLKKFYRWLTRQQLLVSNPSLWLEGLKIPLDNVETREISEEKVRELLLKLQAVDYTTALHRALIVVLLYTGMRVGEALKLKISNIYQLNTHWVLEWMAKNNKKLTLPLHPVAMDSIRDLVAWGQKIGMSYTGESYLFRPTPIKGKIGVGPLHQNSAYKIFKEAFATIGVDGVSPHSARVTVISQMVSQGVPLQDVADTVGHSSIVMTRAYAKRKIGIEKSPVLGLRY